MWDHVNIIGRHPQTESWFDAMMNFDEICAGLRRLEEQHRDLARRDLDFFHRFPALDEGLHEVAAGRDGEFVRRLCL